MNPTQVNLLFQASQTPELTDAQRQKLTLLNPWTQSGPVAMVMQRRVAEIDPVQAKQWIQDAGATLSLTTAAASLGITEMTMAASEELSRMAPKTDEELRQEGIEDVMSRGNPFGEPARIEEGRMIPKGKGNLTDQHRLKMLDPALAEKMERLSNPQPAHNFTDREVMILRSKGFAVPGEG